LGRLDIHTEADLQIAVLHVQRNKQLTESFGTTDIAMLATVASELGRNILKYGDAKGYLLVTWIDDEPSNRGGVEIKAVDRGPGFVDKQSALCDHYSTSGTLGLGLPGVARIMDALEIESEPGAGAVVTATMRLRRDRKY
jgi:serine/threonine-protein kinase RsbT